MKAKTVWAWLLSTVTGTAIQFILTAKAEALLPKRAARGISEDRTGPGRCE
jgi:hypothetical protein